MATTPAAAGLRLALVNARLIDPATGLDAPGGVLIEGERIAHVGPGLSAGSAPDGMELVDCEGLCLAPGLVDMRVQLRDPGEEHKETVETASAAAAAGGVTTMVCLPNTKPVIDDVSLVESVLRRGREDSLVNILPYAAVTRGLQGREITEMGLLAEAGAVGFTDGTVAVADARVMRRALTYARMFDRVIVQHPEEPALARDGAMNEGTIATRIGLPGIPAAAEVMMIERDLRLVELTRGRYHVAHISTAAAIEAVRRAKDRGLRVTAETAPPYFALNEIAVGEYRTFAKVSPPLRGEADRQAVIAGLRDGTIDCIASDHAPHDQDSKRLPFAQAAFGAVGLETLLAVTLELVHTGALSLADAIGKLTVAPAALLGLEAGRLAKGAPADLVLFDPDRAWKITSRALRSKSKNTPFDGKPVQGRVVRTWVAGELVHEAA